MGKQFAGRSRSGAGSKDASSLPAPSAWYDFWTGERHEGAREVTKTVDLDTMPLYVRAGAILPLGQVKQFTGEKIDEPLSVSIYPGADGAFLLYEDDGTSFNYRNGEWMGTQLTWNDARKVLRIELVPGSRMLLLGNRPMVVKVADISRSVTFDGTPVEVDLSK